MQLYHEASPHFQVVNFWKKAALLLSFHFSSGSEYTSIPFAAEGHPFFYRFPPSFKPETNS